MTPTIAGKVLSVFNRNGRITAGASDFELSDRELKVLRLLADGLTYTKIAERLSLTYATVNAHVTCISAKLQVRSVASAVSLALREGMV